MSGGNRRVIMVCSQMPPIYGGAGTQAAMLAEQLVKRGWQVSAITLDQQGVGSGKFRGVDFRRVMHAVSPTGWRRATTTIALGLTSFFRVLITRPAVVHVHGAYWWSVPPVVAGRLVGARVVVKTTRDGEDDPHTVFTRRVGWLPVGWLYGLSLRLADIVVVLNSRTHQVALDAGLARTVRLIPNGVDHARFRRTGDRRSLARRELGVPPDARVVLFVGYLAKHKGVLDLLAAWRTLDDRQTALWLVGPLTGFYRELDDQVALRLKELTDEGFNLRAFGHQSDAAMPAIYWCSDVFVLPSYAEGMPNSMAEAVVAGCDVVGTRIPGIIDILGEDSADLFEPGDVDALASQLRLAINDPRGSSPELIARLSMDSVTDTYEQLYETTGS